MYRIKYDELADKLIEEYPVEENPELYTLYSSMLEHLLKIFDISRTTAIRLMTRVLERRLNIHFYRNNEFNRMKSINIHKIDDRKKYFRILYWTEKIPMETAIEIYNKYNDISSALVKKYMYETGKLSDAQIKEYYASRKYYYAHHEANLARKRAYRARKKKEKENEKIYNKNNQIA